MRNTAFEAVLGLTRHATLASDDAQDLRSRMARTEAAILVDALTRYGGQINPVVALLGIPRKTLYDKLSRHGISARDFRVGRRKSE